MSAVATRDATAIAVRPGRAAGAAPSHVLLSDAGLPHARKAPLDADSPELAALGREAVALIEKELGPGERPRLALVTRTRVDVGFWLRNVRVRVAAAPSGLVLVAPGRRPYVERVPFAALGGTLYNHVTGEVVLAPGPGGEPGRSACGLGWPGVRAERLRLAPVEGYALLAEIRDGLG